MGNACSYTSVVMSISTAQGESVGGLSSPFLTFFVEKERITPPFTERTSIAQAV